MVRLNESASAQMESVDLLKRRFLRQNKEIIRANSDQSIRIRTLEAEQSRLLSENITLREANIRLNHELTKSRHALALENVGNVRHKLETFAAGLGGLLAELAEAHTKLPQPTPLHESAKRRSPKTSPNQRARPGTNGLGALVEEGHLTPIIEGKHYPRKTLSPSALGAVEEQHVAMSDSPDLGPPPVVQYDMGDPIKQSPLSGRTRDLSADLREEEPQDLFVNLEKRKKRRSSMFAKDAEQPLSLESAMGDGAVERSSSEECDLHSVGKPVKSSGKRKLSMREDYDNRRPADDFEYSKKVQTEEKKSATLAIRGGKPEQTIYHRKPTDHLAAKPKPSEPPASTVSLRKALGEKPVNTDPMVSPAKTKSKANKGSRGDPMKADPIKTDPPPRPNSAASIRKNHEPHQKQQREDQKAEVKVTQVFIKPLEPATPAVVDIVSPMDVSAPSTVDGPISRDTPPPSDLSGRPSRRSRPAVSYAEPKLNHKMRRPGKELVDAVPDDKSKRLSFASTSVGPGSEPPSSTTDALPNWQSITSEAPSPLPPKQNMSTESDSELKTDKKRRMSRASDETKTAEEQAAARESKIAEIVNISNRRLSRVREAAEARSQAQNADTRTGSNKSEQDIFDFIDKSSPETVATRSLSSKTHRRISSVPDKLANAGTETGIVRSSSRRRETLMTANTNEKEKDGEGDESQVDDVATGRGGKMLTRRKSMMV